MILVAFLFSYSLYWISPRPNTADLALIRLTSYLYGLTCYLYGIGQNSRATPRSRAALNELRGKNNGGDSANQ